MSCGQHALPYHCIIIFAIAGARKGKSKRTPARTVAEHFTEDEDEEEEDGAGVTLKALAQIAAATPGASSGLDR